MSSGGNPAEQIRLAGPYAGRLLKGEKSDDLPAQQSAKVELIINLETVLGHADEVCPVTA